MSFRWSENITYKFITKYLEHECLWNIKSPYYKNKQMKQAAYKDLENAMGIPGFGEKEVKIKIKNIRSTYSQEKKKIRDSKGGGGGDEAVYIPTLRWFNLLDSSLRDISTYITKSENISFYEEITHTDNTDTEEKGAAEDPFTERVLTPPPMKKKKLNQCLNIKNHVKDITETTYSSDDSEFAAFGRHVAVQLKSLPILLALEAQEHIQLYINRIRRRHLTTNAIFLS